MLRKLHNHILQTNPRRREEEPQNLTVTRHQEGSVFLLKKIAKLERTLSNANKLNTILGTPTNNVRNIIQLITIEPPHLVYQQPKPPGGGGG